MTDNTTISVKFEDKRSSSVIESSNTVYCKLTDGYQPSVLKVNVVDSRTLEVEFSEAVLRGDHVVDDPNNIYAADRIQNYAIDAKDLESFNITTGTTEEGDSADADTVYSISEKVTDENNDSDAGSVTVGGYSNAVDSRNIVTIRLGADRVLEPGSHSLAISNVGDWAAATDGWRNIVNTATVDFVVPEDNETPDFKLEVMSPEQYKLTANCSIGVASGKTFRTEDSSAIDTDIVILEHLKGSEWTPISNDINYDTVGSGTNAIMVSQIKDLKTGLLTNEYLVETKADWTKILNTRGTYNNYYNNRFRLRIPANSVRNLANNKWNASDIIIDLSSDPIMQSMDGTSPTIKSIEQIQDADGTLTDKYQVTFSEPVKMSDGSNNKEGANKEGMTPTQDVTSSTLYSAYFVKRDSTQKTVQAEVNHKKFIDAVDTMIQVEPVAKLDAGDWDLYVRGVADDVGNTVPTLSGMVHVDEQTVTTNFRVVWAAVSSDGTYNGITAGEGHYIFVKFNKPIRYYGGSTNAASTLNYQVNGSPLPAGSSIRAHIQGYDQQSDVIDSITIILPDGKEGTSLGANTMNYPVSGKNCILTISSAITSSESTDDTLATEPGYNMPYQYGDADTELGSSFGLSTQGDAVWGNHSSEQASAYGSEKKAYISALKAALQNDKYRKVVLDGTYAGQELELGDLTINRIVDIELNGCSIIGNITVNTTTAAYRYNIGNTNTNYISTITGASSAEGSTTLTVNTPYADVDLVGGDYFEVIAKEGVNDAKALNIQGVPYDTFVNNATIKGRIVLSGNNIGLMNSGKLDNAPIVVDTAGTVKLEGNYNDTTVTLEKKATLNLNNITEDTKVKVTAKISGSIVVVPSGNKAEITAEAADIVVKYDDISDVTLKTNGGTFKQQSLTGDDRTESDLADEESSEAEAWIAKLTVIDQAEEVGEGGSLVEYTTGSAVTSGSGFFFTSNGKENLETGLKEKTASDADYEITSVTPSVSATYLTSSSSEKKVGVKDTVTSIKTKVTNEFTIRIVVKDKHSGESVTVTKTIKVTINPAENS